MSTAPTCVLGLVGFYAVHHLSVRRQRRDEFFKLVQSILGQIETVTEDAASVWSTDFNGSVSDATHVLASNLSPRVSRLSSQLAMLKRRQGKFDQTSEIIRFRQAITKDIEATPRAANRIRAGEIRVASIDLERAIQEGLLRVYG